MCFGEGCTIFHRFLYHCLVPFENEFAGILVYCCEFPLFFLHHCILFQDNNWGFFRFSPAVYVQTWRPLSWIASHVQFLGPWFAIVVSNAPWSWRPMCCCLRSMTCGLLLAWFMPPQKETSPVLSLLYLLLSSPQEMVLIFWQACSLKPLVLHFFVPGVLPLLKSSSAIVLIGSVVSLSPLCFFLHAKPNLICNCFFWMSSRPCPVLWDFNVPLHMPNRRGVGGGEWPPPASKTQKQTFLFVWFCFVPWPCQNPSVSP